MAPPREVPTRKSVGGSAAEHGAPRSRSAPPEDTSMTDIEDREEGPDRTQEPESTVHPAPTTTEVRNAAAAVGALQVTDNPPPTAVGGPSSGIPQGPIEQAVAAALAADQAGTTSGPTAAPPIRQMVTEALNDWLAQTIQVNPNGNRVAPDVAAASSTRLSTRDVKLPPFSGSTDPGALHIDSAFYLPMIEWVNEARTLLHFSGLPPTQQVFAIFNALTGPARRVLMLHGVDNTTTPDALLDKLVEGIPDHGTVFTNQALEMTFKLKTLRKDIETFGLLVSYGELPTTGTRFWFQHLIRKLLAAKSDLLMLSASLLNMHLDYREAEPFQHLIARAVDIVTRLQQEGRLVQTMGSALASDVGESAGRRGNAPNKRKQAQSDAATKPPKTPRGPSFEELAKQYNRCSKCGYHYKPPALASHEASCPGDAVRFKSRMGRVRMLVSQGKGDKVNTFPPGKPTNK